MNVPVIPLPDGYMDGFVQVLAVGKVAFVLRGGSNRRAVHIQRLQVLREGTAGAEHEKGCKQNGKKPAAGHRQIAPCCKIWKYYMLFSGLFKTGAFRPDSP